MSVLARSVCRSSCHITRVDLPSVTASEPGVPPLPLDRHTLHTSEAEREAMIELHRVADSFRRKAVSAMAGRLTRHRPTLPPEA